MSLNFDQQLGLVERSVSSVEVEGKSAKAVTLTRDYATTVDDLWDALTNRERLPRWFLPISGDLRLGGHYQLEGNAGGKITACEPPVMLTVTWEWQSDISWLELRLAENGENSSRLILCHTALVSDFWTEYGPGATGTGWELGLVGLDIHLSDPAAEKIDEEQLAASPEGKAYMIQSSTRWGEASIAAGTPTDAALKAVQKINAFYTGEASEDS